MSPTRVPFTSIPLGKTTFQITTSVGKSLQTYDLRRGLQLVFLSRPQCPDQITAVCAYRDRVFVAWGGHNGSANGVWVFKRGKLVAELENASSPQHIQHIVVLGNWIVGCASGRVEIWKNDTYEHYTSIVATATSGVSAFTGTVCTLPTYLNKIFVGRQDGNVEIYNVTTGKLVHTLEAASTLCGPVTALSPSTALCVLAVAYADGSICLFDVDTHEIVLSLRSKDGKAVTSISFRSDGAGAGEDGRKEGVMATAGLESGDITMWDLNRGAKITGILRNAHETSASSLGSGISKVEFLPSQPVLVSSGLDNSIRSWIFDQNPFSPIPRPLHVRRGHGAPVTELMFMPAASDGSEASGKWLLSAGQDRSLWGFSLRKDSQNAELSQGDIKHKSKKLGQLSDDRATVEDLKAPPIVDMACCLNRDGGMGAVSGQVWSNPKSVSAEESSMTGWESVVTAHAGDRFARTWSWGRKKAGRWSFETGDQKPVTSVAITACGTFALVGSAGGSIDMFNLQSGTHRQRFPPRLKPSQAKGFRNQDVDHSELLEKLRGHRALITGLVVDSLNQTLVSTSLDGNVIFWSFSTGQVLRRLRLEGTSVLRMKYNSVSNLIALSCDDLCIRIVDIETRRVVRELWGCVGQVNDLAFSHDGHWVVACSMDSAIRVFDLATGHLIDAFRTETCINVAFSSTGEYLATTHAGVLGINIWTNKSLYSHIVPRQIQEDSIIDLTDTLALGTASQLALNGSSDPFDPLSNGDFTKSTDSQLDSALLTLSLTPRARWQTLLNLENIRQRNKPIQPPEKPKAAPFFLGSALSLANSDPQQSNSAKSIIKDNTRISTLASLTPASTVTDTVIADILSASTPTAASSQTLTTHLTSLPPSATHLFLSTLPLSSLPFLIDNLTLHLQTHRDYELLNTWMAVILKSHAEFVAEVEEVRKALVQWSEVNEEESRRLDGMVGFVGGVVGGWLRSAR